MELMSYTIKGATHKSVDITLLVSEGALVVTWLTNHTYTTFWRNVTYVKTVLEPPTALLTLINYSYNTFRSNITTPSLVLEPATALPSLPHNTYTTFNIDDTKTQTITWSPYRE